METLLTWTIRRPLADGRIIDVYELIGGRARLCIGPADIPVYDDLW
jgi:hypothetical protein